MTVIVTQLLVPLVNDPSSSISFGECCRRQPSCLAFEIEWGAELRKGVLQMLPLFLGR